MANVSVAVEIETRIERDLSIAFQGVADDQSVNVGTLLIVDRKKDMIVSGGFNIFPREIEDVLSSHPDVAMAAVIGVPHEKWGEAVAALIVARAGVKPSPESLIQLVKDRKGSTHAPKQIEIVDSLPLTAVGKVDKKVLRARYWASQARQVG